MDNLNIKELEIANTLEVYPKRDVVIVRGDGALLWDDQNNEYIDCTAGVGVANIGHANADVSQAITMQSQRLITCPGIFYNDTRANFLKKLVEITPARLKRAFLCNSGTESMEAALKFARLSSGKNEFICAMRGFHGRTMGALSATFKYRDAFEPLIPGFNFIPFNNIEKLTTAISETTAGIVLELVQGEGGVRIADREFIKKVQSLCAEQNILLIVDEVQTGFGRSGQMFACNHYNLQPDLFCLAKGIAGGLPMGAVLCSDRIDAAVGQHGSTFGGNPLACAAALASIKFIEEHDLCQQAKLKGDYFATGLKKTLPSVVREIRQLGLMIGIELKTKAKPYLLRLINNGVLALPAGPTVIRLLPPLVISNEQIDEVVKKLLACLHEPIQ